MRVFHQERQCLSMKCLCSLYSNDDLLSCLFDCLPCFVWLRPWIIVLLRKIRVDGSRKARRHRAFLNAFIRSKNGCIHVLVTADVIHVLGRIFIIIGLIIFGCFLMFSTVFSIMHGCILRLFLGLKSFVVLILLAISMTSTTFALLLVPPIDALLCCLQTRYATF